MLKKPAKAQVCLPSELRCDIAICRCALGDSRRLRLPPNDQEQHLRDGAEFQAECMRAGSSAWLICISDAISTARVRFAVGAKARLLAFALCVPS